MSIFIIKLYYFINLGFPPKENKGFVKEIQMQEFKINEKEKKIKDIDNFEIIINFTIEIKENFNNLNNGNYVSNPLFELFFAFLQVFLILYLFIIILILSLKMMVYY